MIKLDRLDPDWKFAENHAKANKAGYGTTLPSMGSSINLLGKSNNTLCKCCLNPIHKEEIPLGEHSKQLQVLGFGFPLFYQFLKNCILLLFLSIASYDAMSLRQAVENNHDFCQTNSDHLPSRLLAGSVLKCYTFFVEMSRIQSQVSREEEVMRIISFVVHLIGLIYVRNRLVKLDKYYNQRTPTFVDFSIIIKGLPKVKGIQQKLREFFENEYPKQFPQDFLKQPKVLHFTLLPQYPQMQVLFKQRLQITNKLRSYYDKGQQAIDSDEAIQLRKQLRIVEQKLHDTAMESNQVFQKDELQCQKVICIFNEHREKQLIVNNFKKIKKQTKEKYFGKNYKDIYIQQAPEPTQIDWQNVNLPKRQRVFKIFVSYLLSLLALVAIFVIIFFILQQKSLHLAHAIQLFDLNNSNQFLISQYRGAIALVYIAMFLIVIFNKTVLSILFHKFTHLERHTTTAKFQFSFQLKLCVGFFFTTALMTLAVQALRFNNYYAHLYGVIDEQSIMFFINSFFIPIFWFVHPFRIVRIIKRKLKYGKRSMTQREANELMEDEHYDMGKRFAQVIKTMWFTFLYSTLLPIGALTSIFGLIVYYWVDKYNLLRRSSVNRQVSGRLIHASLNLLDFTLFLKPIGSIIFDKQLRDQALPSTIVMVVVGFIYVVIPKNKIVQFLDNERFRQHSLTFKNLKIYPIFTQTYNTEHPVVRIVHDEMIKNKLISRGLTINEAQMMDNMDYLQRSPSQLVKTGKQLYTNKQISTGRQLTTANEIGSPQKIDRNLSTQKLIRQQQI